MHFEGTGYAISLTNPNIKWWITDRIPTSFPVGSDGKESACNAGDLGSIPSPGRSPGKGMATHSSILAWEIPWTQESTGHKESDTTLRLTPYQQNPSFYSLWKWRRNGADRGGKWEKLASEVRNYVTSDNHNKNTEWDSPTAEGRQRPQQGGVASRGSVFAIWLHTNFQIQWGEKIFLKAWP